MTWKRCYDAAGRLLEETSSSGERVTFTYDLTGRRTKQTSIQSGIREYSWNGLSRLTQITDHQQDQVVVTSTVTDALGYLARVGSQELFFDTQTGQPADLDGRTLLYAGPLTGLDQAGWLDSSWSPDRVMPAANPYQTPAKTPVGDLINIGSKGEISVAGLEWLGARVLDPNSASFLSPDPLDPTIGSGWAAAPYAYAGNNPVGLFDPSGLRPITAEELGQYRVANAPKWGSALAMAAGIALAFVPGTQGFAAAIIIGAVSGGAGSAIDQLCAGVPLDPKKIFVDSALGMLGGAFGYGIGKAAGKAFSWAAKTPMGKAVTEWGETQLNRIPIVRNLISKLGKETADGAQIPEELLHDANYIPEVRTSTDAGRTLKDINVNPGQPDLLPLKRPIGGNSQQNQWLQDRIKYLKGQGADKFRVNQQMINQNGVRVGTNRPDLQYSHNGVRIYEEVDTISSKRGIPHADRIFANDPLGKVILWTIGK